MLTPEKCKQNALRYAEKARLCLSANNAYGAMFSYLQAASWMQYFFLMTEGEYAPLPDIEGITTK